MRSFLVVTFCYFGLALALLVSLGHGLDLATRMLLELSSDRLGLLQSTAIWFLPLALIGPILTGRRDRIPAALMAAAGCVLLQSGFSLIKSMIPFLVPFYADPWLAQMDQALHGGADPWVALHGLVNARVIEIFLPLYLHVWIIPAMALPVFIAATDGDTVRRDRFLILFLFCWMCLGNVVAILGASVGPVFYDGTYGTTRFAALVAELHHSGFSDGMIGRIQAYQWDSYVTKALLPASGISAFPSVHVAIAMLVALYIAERWRRWWPAGLLFVAAILFLSVYTGYHYAIDGYFSILAVVGVWFCLRLRAKRSYAQENYAAD